MLQEFGAKWQTVTTVVTTFEGSERLTIQC